MDYQHYLMDPYIRKYGFLYKTDSLLNQSVNYLQYGLYFHASLSLFNW